MKVRGILSAAMLVTALAWAGSGYGQSSGGGRSMMTPHVSTNAMGLYGGSYDEMGLGGTIAGSYLAGRAAFAQGLGQYNYDTALAVRQLEDANRQAIDNQLYAQRSYFEMRRVNDEYWLSKNPRSTPEQKALIDQSRLPRRLTSSELDPTWNLIRWPAVLQQPEFDAIRAKLDDVFAHRSEERFGIGTPEYARVKGLTREMRALLDKEYDSMSQMEWIQAMRFLESLGYETRFAPGVAVGVNAR